MCAAPAPVIKKRPKAAKPKKAAAKPSKAKASKGKKAKAAKPAAAKRAPGPYMVFCKEKRSVILKQNPGMSFGEVGKALGAAWGKLSEAEKAKYKK